MCRFNARKRELCLTPLLVVVCASTPVTAQTIVNACYVPTVGALYVVSTGGPPASTTCLSPTHTALSWRDPYIALTGDLGGTFPNASVVGLQGYAVGKIAPTDGQVLTWNNANTRWQPSTPTSGGVTAHSSLTGLTTDDHPQYLLGSGARSSLNGFAVTGGLGAGTIPALGPGVRMMWYPGAAAFRAGSVDGAQWNTPGQYSVAMGLNTIASNTASVALGTADTASGHSAVALGWKTAAIGNQAFATGVGSRAVGNASVAMGTAAVALGESSIALGANSTTNAPWAFAVGKYAKARGLSSIAIGELATADREYSVALGGSTRASDVGAFAAGLETVASAENATALGYRTLASGIGSTALGYSSAAAGMYSTALGYGTSASGYGSLAFGFQSTADIPLSIALGYNAHTNGHVGTFVFADASSPNQTKATADYQFMVRAAGGVVLNTNAGQTTGCSLAAGSGVWACTSSRFQKTDFAVVSGESILTKIRDLPVETWRYRNESPSVRHMGPYAEDFRAAFGLGTDNVTIGHIDESGVALAAAKALEVRTRELREELERKGAEIELLKSQIAELLKRMDTMDARRAP